MNRKSIRRITPGGNRIRNQYLAQKTDPYRRQIFKLKMGFSVKYGAGSIRRCYGAMKRIELSEKVSGK
jgi:hypothetical protein